MIDFDRFSLPRILQAWRIWLNLILVFTVLPPHTPVRYYAWSGDTVGTVALRFGVQPDEIASPQPLPKRGLLTPGQLLILPPRLYEMQPAPRLLPDSEIVYGPAAIDFDVAAYLKQAGGYLATHQEYLESTDWTSAAEVTQRVALEYSINPKLLLALFEQHCHCVSGKLDKAIDQQNLLGVTDYLRAGLYGQLSWAAYQLSVGYYGWRSGQLLQIDLPGGRKFTPAPDSNAGTVALQYYFIQRDWLVFKQSVTDAEKQAALRLLNQDPWKLALDQQEGFPALYRRMFGDPWRSALARDGIYPAHLTQPDMLLPFEIGRSWSYTSGPHKAWEADGPLAALDFAPATYEPGCIPTDAWVTAVADGPVVRSEFGYVVQDLDDSGLSGGPHPDLAEGGAASAGHVKSTGSARGSDGKEQTGWVILYMHIAASASLIEGTGSVSTGAAGGRVPAGTYLHAGDRIGHPSCEGGPATGTHLHIARKYNGEWVAADGPLPFNLSGWIAQAGSQPYQGWLVKDGKVVVAHPFGSFETLISRQSTARSAGAVNKDLE